MTTATLKADTKQATPIRNAVTDILKVLENFSALLNDETAALKRSDFATVDSLQENKRMIARTYHDMVTALGARAEELQSLDMPMREKLIRTRTTFTLILNDNMRVLELVKRSTQRLSERILDIARLSVVDNNQTSYGMKGNVQSYKSSTLSTQLDRSL